MNRKLYKWDLPTNHYLQIIELNAKILPFLLLPVKTPIFVKLFGRAKPFFAVIFLQFGLAGMDILSKAALSEGMSNYVFVVYRHAIATVVIAPFAIILDKSISLSLSLSYYMHQQIIDHLPI